MGKIIHTTNASTLRNQSLRMIASALPEIFTAKRSEAEALDLGAFIFAHLKNISKSVDQTALAWEKRDYWVKADAFRRQWNWIEKPLQTLEASLLQKNASALADALRGLSGVLPPQKSPVRKIQNQAWSGSWKKLFSDP